MKSNYKLLGDYIQEVNIRNSELKDLDLLGISIQKEFIPSIANTIGTDMSKYKIVKKNQFAYGTVTSRNGDKISIALLQNYEEALISQAYVSFEVIDENELLPEYLMMWFRRPEFDRYARYMSYGSAREVFSWEEMCNVKLPIPPIEKQIEIVKEYNFILNRIKLKEKVINQLEDTSYTVFKKYFFEHEAIEQTGYNEFERIPENWKIESLSNTAKYLNGLAMQKYIPNKGEDRLPVLKIRELRKGMTDSYSDKCTREIKEEYKIYNGDVIFSWSGSLLVDIWCGGECGLNQHLFKLTSDKYEKWFYYLWTKYHLNEFKKIADGKATTMGHIKREDLENALVLVPSEQELKSIDNILSKLINSLIINKIEIVTLIELKDVLLKKLTLE